MAVETSVYSPFNRLPRLQAREYFIEFSRRETLNYVTLNALVLTSDSPCLMSPAVLTKGF
jgi:hypothetical protein